MPRRLCVVRYVVELYEVTNWEKKPPKDWRLGDETWECDGLEPRSGGPTLLALPSKSGFGPPNMVPLACGGGMAMYQEKKWLLQDTVKKNYK